MCNTRTEASGEVHKETPSQNLNEVLAGDSFHYFFFSCHANGVSPSYNFTEYICPQNRTCLPSFQWCTPDEILPVRGKC